MIPQIWLLGVKNHMRTYTKGLRHSPSLGRIRGKRATAAVPKGTNLAGCRMRTQVSHLVEPTHHGLPYLDGGPYLLLLESDCVPMAISQQYRPLLRSVVDGQFVHYSRYLQLEGKITFTQLVLSILVTRTGVI